MHDLRIDPITKKISIHKETINKPLPKIERIINYAEGQRCDFCEISKQVRETNSKVKDHDNFERNVLDLNSTAYALVNRWGVLDTENASHHASELVIVQNHVHSLEDLTETEVNDFGDLLEKRYNAMSRYYNFVGCFINCGVNAGGSVAHLHGQVVGYTEESAPESSGFVEETSQDRKCSVCEDLLLAEKHNTIISTKKYITYAPYSPSSSLEIRIAGLCALNDKVGANMLSSARQILASLSKLDTNWPYNIIINYNNHSYAQLFLRVDSGLVYSYMFNKIPITVNLEKFAKLIQENL